MMIMKVKRQVPANGINGIFNKKYLYMEEKLKYFFDLYHDNEAIIPLVKFDKDWKTKVEEYVVIDPNDIIGTVESFTDTDFEVTIFEEHMGFFNSLKEPRIQIAALMMPIKDDCIPIERVIKIQLADKNH